MRVPVATSNSEWSGIVQSLIVKSLLTMLLLHMRIDDSQLDVAVLEAGASANLLQYSYRLNDIELVDAAIGRLVQQRYRLLGETL